MQVDTGLASVEVQIRSREQQMVVVGCMDCAVVVAAAKRLVVLETAVESAHMVFVVVVQKQDCEAVVHKVVAVVLSTVEEA